MWFLVHEERVATLEAVQKTAKEQVSGETQRNMLGRLQVIKASIAALSGAAYLRPAVAITDPLT